MNYEQIQYQGDELRLDICLKNFFSEYSRTYLEKLIEKGFVEVNSKIARKSGFKVKNKDFVSVAFPPVAALEQNGLDLDILFEHEDFLILNKPAGVLTHPSLTSEGQPSILGALYDRLEEVSAFSDPSRPGIVHRLDKDTSGILIVAKNPKAFHRFGEIFQQRRIQKYYLTVAAGQPSKDSYFINKPIGRDPRNPKRMSIRGIAAKEAKSEVEVLERLNRACFLKVQILTGRTHQIRVHLASQQLFVLGDSVYGMTTDLITRQALHAHHVKFFYKGKPFEFFAPLPEDMTLLLNRLKDVAG